MKGSFTRSVCWLAAVSSAGVVCGCLLQLNPDTKLAPSAYFQSCDLGSVVDASIPETDAEVVWHDRRGDGPSTTKGPGVGVVTTSRGFTGSFTTVRDGATAPADPAWCDELLRDLLRRLEDGLRAGGMHVTTVKHFAPNRANWTDRKLVDFEISFDRTDERHNLRHIGQIKAALEPSKVPEGAQTLTVTLIEDARAIVY